MQINITIFIQIINFIITYKVLTHFLFKPAVASLEAKQKRQENLYLEIAQQEEELVTLEKAKVAAVIAFQTTTKQRYPFRPLYSGDKPLEVGSIEPKVIDKKQAEKRLVDWLTSKVPDGY